MGAIVRHCVGINFARCSNFSSSSRDHSILRILGSSHSTQRALHCFGVFRASSDDTRAHWLRPYFDTYQRRCQQRSSMKTFSWMDRHTLALSTSSSKFVLEQVRNCRVHSEARMNLPDASFDDRHGAGSLVKTPAEADRKTETQKQGTMRFRRKGIKAPRLKNGRSSLKV